MRVSFAFYRIRIYKLEFEEFHEAFYSIGMMLGYQWPFQGRKLVQTLNYANSFEFMLYGWDPGKE